MSIYEKVYGHSIRSSATSQSEDPLEKEIGKLRSSISNFKIAAEVILHSPSLHAQADDLLRAKWKTMGCWVSDTPSDPGMYYTPTYFVSDNSSKWRFSLPNKKVTFSIEKSIFNKVVLANTELSLQEQIDLTMIEIWKTHKRWCSDQNQAKKRLKKKPDLCFVVRPSSNDTTCWTVVLKDKESLTFIKYDKAILCQLYSNSSTEELLKIFLDE